MKTNRPHRAFATEPNFATAAFCEQLLPVIEIASGVQLDTINGGQRPIVFATTIGNINTPAFQGLPKMIAQKLQQGDILAKCTKKNPPSYFLTLTPDCDIFNNKFRNIITVLPLIRISDYVESVFFSGELMKSLSQFEELFTSLDDHSIDSVFFFEHILPDCPEKAFKNFLGKSAPPEYKVVRDFYLSNGDPTSAYLELCKTRKASVSKRIKGCLKNIQQDFFFINTLPRCPEFGFLVDLRRPESVPAEKILFHNASASDGEMAEHFIHMGSLPDSIRFALAQAFSSLFSRIGMPTEFESERDQIIELFEEKFA